MWVCRIVTSSSEDLRSRCPLCKLPRVSHLKLSRSPRPPLEYTRGCSYLRFLPSKDGRGPPCPPKPFHEDDESDLRRHCRSHSVPWNWRCQRSGRTVCPRLPVPLERGPQIVSGTHPENYRRGKRKASLMLFELSPWVWAKVGVPCLSAATLIAPTPLLSGRIKSFL